MRPKGVEGWVEEAQEVADRGAPGVGEIVRMYSEEVQTTVPGAESTLMLLIPRGLIHGCWMQRALAHDTPCLPSCHLFTAST